MIDIRTSKLGRRKFLKGIGIAAAGVLVPRLYFTKPNLAGIAVESSPKEADCLISYSCVDYELLKACRRPEIKKKEACYLHTVGMQRVVEEKKREVSYFEETSLGPIRTRDGSGKYYWADTTQIIAHLRSLND